MKDIQKTEILRSFHFIRSIKDEVSGSYKNNFNQELYVAGNTKIAWWFRNKDYELFSADLWNLPLLLWLFFMFSYTSKEFSIFQMLY